MIKIRNISVCSILSWGKNTFFQIIVPWALHKLYDRIKQTPKKVRCCFSKWIAWRIFHYFVGHPYNCVVIALRHFGFCRFHQIFRSRSICCPQGIHASLIRVRMKRTSSRKQHFPPWSLSPIQLNPPPFFIFSIKKRTQAKQNCPKKIKAGCGYLAIAYFPFMHFHYSWRPNWYYFAPPLLIHLIGLLMALNIWLDWNCVGQDPIRLYQSIKSN